MPKPAAFLLFSLAAILLPAAAPAQTPERRTVEVRFACLRFAEGVRSVFVRSDPEKEPEEVRLYQGGFGQPIPLLVEAGQAHLYARGAEVEGKVQWKPVASLAIPDGERKLTVLLLPAGSEGGNEGEGKVYQSMPLPLPADFPWGAAMAVNLTRWDTRVLLGRKVIGLKPGTRNIARFESEKDDYDTVPVIFTALVDGQAVTLHSTRWNWNARVRHIAVVWMNRATRRPEITTLKETLPVEVKPPAG